MTQTACVCTGFCALRHRERKRQQGGQLCVHVAKVGETENTVPPGLWPLILEWCTLGKEKEGYNESVLFYLLTLWPYLVKGKA